MSSLIYGRGDSTGYSMSKDRNLITAANPNSNISLKYFEDNYGSYPSDWKTRISLVTKWSMSNFSVPSDDQSLIIGYIICVHAYNANGV